MASATRAATATAAELADPANIRAMAWHDSLRHPMCDAEARDVISNTIGDDDAGALLALCEAKPGVSAFVSYLLLGSARAAQLGQEPYDGWKKSNSKELLQVLQGCRDSGVRLLLARHVQGE
jgi:hypothetical protein